MASKKRGSVTGSQQKMPFVARLEPPHAPYNNAQEYLRAIDHRDLPQTIRDCLKNDTEMDYYIASALRTAPVQRPLEFKHGLNPGDHRQFTTLRPWHNVHALFVYITGNENITKCQTKVSKDNIRDTSCTNMFARCVVPRSDLNYVSGGKFNTSACANHQYQCMGSKCVLDGVAQIQPIGTQPGAALASGAQTQAPPNHPQPAASQPAGLQPAALQYDPSQALHDYAPPVHQPIAAQHGSAQPCQANAQAYLSQGHAARDYDHGDYPEGHGDQNLAAQLHDEQGPMGQDVTGQDHGAPSLQGEGFEDVDLSPLAQFNLQHSQHPGLPPQNMSPATAASNAFQQPTEPQASVFNAHGPLASAFQTHVLQDHSGPGQFNVASPSAHQPGLAGMEHSDQQTMHDPLMGTPSATATQIAPYPAYDQVPHDQEEYYHNSGAQM